MDKITAYMCDHCKKILKSKQGMKIHEFRCLSNPKNKNICNNHVGGGENCEYLGWKSVKVKEGIMLARYCDKLNVCVYSARYKVGYETIGYKNIVMPKYCNHYIPEIENETNVDDYNGKVEIDFRQDQQTKELRSENN